MFRTLVVAVAVVVAASLSISQAQAQTKMDRPAAPKSAADPTQAGKPHMDKPMGLKVEGTVKSVDRNGTVTLADGTKLTVPKSVAVPPGQLKPGAVITAEYEQHGSEKVATAIHIKG